MLFVSISTANSSVATGVTGGTVFSISTFVTNANSSVATGVPGGGTGGHALEHRPPVSADPTVARSLAVRWHGLWVHQPQPFPIETAGLGRYRRVAVPAPIASRTVPLAAAG